MKVRLMSIGTATPAGVLEAARALELALALKHPEASAALIRRLHAGSGVARRGVEIIGSDGGLQLFVPGERPNPTTAQRLALYSPSAGRLAVEASRRAMAGAGLGAGKDGGAGLITHVVTASCTGGLAPGLDRRLIDELGLRADIRRTHVGFMGCHAAINALAVAAAFARADGGRVLVCCAEVCSVHMHHSARPDRLVANALFADGAAAAVVAVSDDVRGPSVEVAESVVLPQTQGLMAWEIGDHGFEMTLDAQVPRVLGTLVPGWLSGVLERQGLARGDVAGWAIHPGGPRVVGEIAEGLGLSAGATGASLDVLREHGNMSSATVLFVLARLLGWDGDGGGGGAGVVGGPLVMAAFGPGLAGEVMVLRAG